jgi:hypothetical protein
MGRVRSSHPGRGAEVRNCKRVLPSPSRFQPGNTGPRRRHSSRPRQTPHTEAAVSSPRAHHPPARSPSRFRAPSSRRALTAPTRNERLTHGSAQAPAAQVLTHQQPGEETPSVFQGRDRPDGPG